MKRTDRPTSRHDGAPILEKPVSPCPDAPPAGHASHPGAAAFLAEAGFAPPATTILLVDDEPFIRIVLSEALTEAGYIVIEAEGPDVAMAALRTHARIDVLMTDVNLDSAVNGHHVAREARGLFPHLKVILMTGDLIADSQRGHEAAIADGILTKPFRLDDMWQMVEALCDQQGYAIREGVSGPDPIE